MNVNLNSFVERSEERKKNYDQNNETNEDVETADPKFSFDSLFNEIGDEGLRIMTGFNKSEIDEIYSFVGAAMTPIGRGRRRSIGLKEQLYIFLVWLASGMSYKSISTQLKLKKTFVTEIIPNIASLIEQPLRSNLIPSKPTDVNIKKEFSHFPEGFGAIGTAIIPINRPKEDSKLYYSGKHKTYCVKIQALITPDGEAVHVSDIFKGSIHNRKIFDISKILEFIEFTNLHSNGKKTEERLTILAGNGYQEVQKYYNKIIIPKKGDAELAKDDITYNKQLSNDRVIVDNFFGRWKILFGVIHEKFKGNTDLLGKVVPITIALTNFHIKKYPLRDNDERIAHEENSSESSSVVDNEEPVG